MELRNSQGTTRNPLAVRISRELSTRGTNIRKESIERRMRMLGSDYNKELFFDIASEKHLCTPTRHTRRCIPRDDKEYTDNAHLDYNNRRDIEDTFDNDLLDYLD